MNDHRSDCPCVPCQADRLTSSLDDDEQSFYRFAVIAVFVFVAAIVFTSIIRGVSP